MGHRPERPRRRRRRPAAYESDPRAEALAGPAERVRRVPRTAAGSGFPELSSVAHSHGNRRAVRRLGARRRCPDIVAGIAGAARRRRLREPRAHRLLRPGGESRRGILVTTARLPRGRGAPHRARRRTEHPLRAVGRHRGGARPRHAGRAVGSPHGTGGILRPGFDGRSRILQLHGHALQALHLPRRLRGDLQRRRRLAAGQHRHGADDRDHRPRARPPAGHRKLPDHIGPSGQGSRHHRSAERQRPRPRSVDGRHHAGRSERGDPRRHARDERRARRDHRPRRQRELPHRQRDRDRGPVRRRQPSRAGHEPELRPVRIGCRRNPAFSSGTACSARRRRREYRCS